MGLQRLRRFFTVTLLATSAVALAACGATSNEDSSDDAPQAKGQVAAFASSTELRTHALESVRGKTVAWVPLGLGSPLMDQWTADLKRLAEGAGMKFVVRDGNWDVTKQASAVQSLINQKPDVLIVHNFQVGLLAKLLDKAQKQGSYVISANMPSNYKGDAFVGFDAHEVGRRMAEDIVASCDGTSGKVAKIDGDPTSGLVLDENAGAKEVFDKHPNIEVVATQSGNWDRTKAHDIASTLLQQHPDLCAIWGTWDQMTYGAAQAVKEAGKLGKVKVFTADHSVIACKGLKEGLFEETWGYSVPEMGTNMMAVAQYLLQSGVKPGSARTAIYTPLTRMTKENYDKPGLCYDGKNGAVTVK
jgi:ribose transport system substrate-binding protein